jgi:TonB family protein
MPLTFEARSPEAFEPHSPTILRVTIDATGKVEEVLIEKTSGSMRLDLAAIEQVRTTAQFKPVLVEGKPVPARFFVGVNWRPK